MHMMVEQKKILQTRNNKYFYGRVSPDICGRVTPDICGRVTPDIVVLKIEYDF
jgi:hypothetical protein